MDRSCWLYHAHQPEYRSACRYERQPNGAIGLVGLAAVVGLIILAKVILPVYYRYNCTTTTELLEKRYNDQRIRALIGLLFLLGNLFIFIPAMLYSGSLFIQTMFNVDLPLMLIAVAFAVVGSAYAVLGGLRPLRSLMLTAGFCCSRWGWSLLCFHSRPLILTCLAFRQSG